MEEDRLANLRRVREVNWAEIEALETKLLREMTVEESLRQFLRIQATLEHQYRATESLFRPEREAHLIELQNRLALIEKARPKSVDTLVESVRQIQNRLETAGIPSVLIGGLAAAVWGTPRGTQDVDLKIMLKRDEARRLMDILGNDFVPFQIDPLAALRGSGIVFVRDQLETRIDLALADTAFDESAIIRGRMVDLMPEMPVRVCSPEDLIVYKLLAPRGRDYDDIVGIIQRQQDALDDAYVIRWLKEFESALDDSTLVRDYQRMRQNKSWRLK